MKRTHSQSLETDSSDAQEQEQQSQEAVSSTTAVAKRPKLMTASLQELLQKALYYSSILAEPVVAPQPQSTMDEYDDEGQVDQDVYTTEPVSVALQSRFPKFVDENQLQQSDLLQEFFTYLYGKFQSKQAIDFEEIPPQDNEQLQFMAKGSTFRLQLNKLRKKQVYDLNDPMVAFALSMKWWQEEIDTSEEAIQQEAEEDDEESSDDEEEADETLLDFIENDLPLPYSFDSLSLMHTNGSVVSPYFQLVAVLVQWDAIQVARASAEPTTALEELRAETLQDEHERKIFETLTQQQDESVVKPYEEALRKVLLELDLACHAFLASKNTGLEDQPRSKLESTLKFWLPLITRAVLDQQYGNKEEAPIEEEESEDDEDDDIQQMLNQSSDEEEDRIPYEELVESLRTTCFHCPMAMDHVSIPVFWSQEHVDGWFNRMEDEESEHVLRHIHQPHGLSVINDALGQPSSIGTDLFDCDLMNQQWKPLHSYAPMLARSTNEGLLDGMVQLMRRAGIMSNSAQAAGEYVFILRNFLQKLIRQVLIAWEKDDDGDDEISCEHVIEAVRKFNMNLYDSFSIYPDENLGDAVEEVESPKQEASAALGEDDVRLQRQDPFALLEAPYEVDVDYDTSNFDAVKLCYTENSSAQGPQQQAQKEAESQPSVARVPQRKTQRRKQVSIPQDLRNLVSFSIKDRDQVRTLVLAEDEQQQQKLYVHTSALASSPMLDSMIQSGMLESDHTTIIQLHESLESIEIAEVFIRYLYDEKTLKGCEEELSQIDWVSLHQAGDFYELPALKSKAERMLLDNKLSVEHVLLVYKYGMVTEWLELCHKCERFLRSQLQHDELVQLLYSSEDESDNEESPVFNDFEKDCLYLMCSSTTMDNIVLKLHDLLRLERELEGGDDQHEEEQEQESDVLLEEDEDTEQIEEATRNRYLKGMIHFRWKEQFIWVIIRNLDAIRRTDVWQSDEWLSAETKDHMEEMALFYKYNSIK